MDAFRGWHCSYCIFFISWRIFDWILDPSNLAPPPAAHALKLKFAEIVPVSTQSILFLEHLQYHPSKPFQTRFSKGIPKKVLSEMQNTSFSLSRPHSQHIQNTVMRTQAQYRSCEQRHAQPFQQKPIRTNSLTECSSGDMPWQNIKHVWLRLATQHPHGQSTHVSARFRSGANIWEWGGASFLRFSLDFFCLSCLAFSSPWLHPFKRF